jgi:serralysin
MGDDTYVVGARGDLVVEMASQGIDTVRSSISYTLGTSLDALTLTGTADLTGTGNALGNTLIGNGADNVLDGDSGKDVLIGGGGTDTFVFRPGETNGDKVMDFNDAGASAGDRLAFSGFGPGATLSQTMGTDVYTITADTDLWGELSETFQIAGVTNLDLIGSLKHDVLLVA